MQDLASMMRSTGRNPHPAGKPARVLAVLAALWVLGPTASPRAAQSLILGAKTRAMLDGRFNASFDDVKASALPALRHRIILSFEGEAEGLRSDDVIESLLKEITP